MPNCQSCGAEVIFVPSAKTGRPMILDAKPTKGIVVASLMAAIGLAPHVLRAPWPADEYRALVVDAYTDHHGTCPKAKAWQGKNRANPPAPGELLELGRDAEPEPAVAVMR